MGYEYMKFNKPATICRKNTAVVCDIGARRRGRVLEPGILTQADFLSLKLKDYEEDHFGTLSLICRNIDVRFGSRNG
jgi:hypothetical protein